MKAAILGCGVVGSGTADILIKGESRFTADCNEPVQLKYILDIRDLSLTPYAPYVVNSIDTIVNDPEVEVVIETMGGVEPAFTFCSKALMAGKGVVTSNKQLVAEKAEALFALAKQYHVGFRFEASVCGVVPVIRTLFTAFASDEIESFYGILNGTCNFILTKMLKDGMDFADALSLAQKNGYAERDPSADIMGLDACRKTAILTSIAYGKHIYPQQIDTQGITAVTALDAALAKAYGGEIKLLGQAGKTPDGVYAFVAPTVVNSKLILSDVEGVFNALNIKGKNSSDVMLYGHGAGKEATASAVVSDVLDLVRVKGFQTNYCWAENGGTSLISHLTLNTRLLIRAEVQNREEAIKAVQDAYKAVEWFTCRQLPDNQIAFLTPFNTEAALRATLEAIGEVTPVSVIRVLE